MLKFDLNSLFVLINLIVFFLLMKKFLFGRIAKVIKERQEIIDKELGEARDTNAKADEKLAEYEEKISGYQAEGDRIIADAKSSAKNEYNKIMNRAEADAKALKAEAEDQIKAETESARKAAKQEIAALAMQAAEKVVGESVTAETDSAIFDEFLNESSDL